MDEHETPEERFKRKQREASMRYYRKNRDAINEKRRNSSEVKERQRLYNRKNYDANSEDRRRRSREYSKANPEWVRESARRRRAQMRGSKTEPYKDSDVLALYGTLCWLCNEEVDLAAPRSTRKAGWERGLHIDHVVLISKGGTDTLDNVRPSHGLCNVRRQK